MAGGNKNRRAGDNFEYRTRDTFRSRGWWIIRAAGSLGPVDLVALKAGQPAVLISCKINGRIDPLEREALLAVANMTGGTPVIAHREQPGWLGVSRLAPSGAREPVGSWHMPALPANPRRRAKAPPPP